MAAAASPSLNLRREAEVLAASYPALMAEAERVAAVVSQGVHGRRRPGQGETFWQYRNYHSSDSAHHIDWRRSARGDQVYVRENEWEAANTVYFWRDGSAGMDWSSSNKLPTKKDRASVLCMALTSLLMRAGERCAVMGESERPRTGRLGLERVTRRLTVTDGAPEIVLTQQNLKQVFNIQVEIDQHPFHLGNRITFDFIGQASSKNKQQTTDRSTKMQRGEYEK